MSSLPPTTTPTDDITSHNDISSPAEEKSSRPSNRERRQQRAQVRAQFTSEHRPKQNTTPTSTSIPPTITRTVDIDATWKFYHDMGNPRMIVAPMVNQSELAFRVLTRRYKADLCYTPMLHAACFSRDAAYRAEHLQTADIDTPTFAQFCANDPQTLLTAALHAQDHVTAIDINFGCPQGIAKRGHYGSFLLSNPTLMCSLVSILFQNLRIPVTCKIRVLDRDEDTIAMCKRLQDAGCSLLTVHGRTKEQLKDKVGTCNFDIIKKIKQSISIPVFANGGIENLADIHRCLEYTGVDGVMTSEAILGNPTIFCGYEADPVGISQEYLDICKIYPTDHSAIRAHLFKFLYKQLTVFPNIRTRLATDHDFDTIIDELKAEEAKCDPTELSARYEAIPTWYRRHLTYVGNQQHVNVGQETNRTTTTEEESEDLSCMFGGCEES